MFDEYIAVTYSDPKSHVSEAYRVLRTNIQFSSIDRLLKVIVVTSSGPMEGKTTTVVNLAVTFAQAGNKVLLIDSDLRKPKIHKVFMVWNEPGLTDVLAVHENYKKYVHKCVVPNLDILTCGTVPPNPSELLSSNVMKQFMQDIRADYDIILMDAPPIGTVTDAAIISTYVDGTILVACAGHVEISAFKHAKEQLDMVNANIIGVVLNKVDKSSGRNYYYGYEYYEDDDGMKKRKRKRRKMNERHPQGKVGKQAKTGSMTQDDSFV